MVVQTVSVEIVMIMYGMYILVRGSKVKPRDLCGCTVCQSRTLDSGSVAYITNGYAVAKRGNISGYISGFIHIVKFETFKEREDPMGLVEVIMD